MESTHDIAWERSLEALAQKFEYPPTPRIDAAAANLARPPARRGRLAGPRLAWALLLLAIVAAAALAVPQTRAAVLSLFARIGAIDIFIDESLPESSPQPLPTAAPTTANTLGHSLQLYQLGEPVTMDEARAAADFPLIVPAALGEPDEAYLHPGVDLPAVTLVWRGPEGEPLSLTEIGTGAFAMKMVQEEDAEWLEIGGRAAVWLEGPHRLVLFQWLGRDALEITSHVLIWSTPTATYRLEGDLSREEMIAIAESLLEE